MATRRHTSRSQFMVYRLLERQRCQQERDGGVSWLAPTKYRSAYNGNRSLPSTERNLNAVSSIYGRGISADRSLFGESRISGNSIVAQLYVPAQSYESRDSCQNTFAAGARHFALRRRSVCEHKLRNVSRYSQLCVTFVLSATNKSVVPIFVYFLNK